MSDSFDLSTRVNDMQAATYYESSPIRPAGTMAQNTAFPSVFPSFAESSGMPLDSQMACDNGALSYDPNSLLEHSEAVSSTGPVPPGSSFTAPPSFQSPSDGVVAPTTPPRLAFGAVRQTKPSSFVALMAKSANSRSDVNSMMQSPSASGEELHTTIASSTDSHHEPGTPSPKRKRGAQERLSSPSSSPQRMSTVSPMSHSTRNSSSNIQPSGSSVARLETSASTHAEDLGEGDVLPPPLPVNDGSTVMNGLLSSPALAMDMSENGSTYLLDIPNDNNGTIASSTNVLDSLDFASDFQSFLVDYKADFPIPSWEDIRNMFAVKYNMKMGAVTSSINKMSSHIVEKWNSIKNLRKPACYNNHLYGGGYFIEDLIGSIEQVHLIKFIQDLARQNRSSSMCRFTGLRFSVTKIFWNDKGLPDVTLSISLVDKENIGRLYQDQFLQDTGDKIEFHIHGSSGNIRSSSIGFPRQILPSPHISFKARNAQYFVPFNLFSEDGFVQAPAPIVSEFQESISFIKLINMDSITEFYSMIINKRGKCLSIRSNTVLEAYSLYFKNLLDEFIRSFDVFCEDPCLENKNCLYRAFIFLSTIPTYLSLFPENKWNKLNCGQLIKYMAIRWEAFLRIRNMEEPILEIINDDCFNKPRSFTYSRKSSIKAAAKAASESLLSKSFDILHRAFNTTPPPEPSENVKYEELKKLHPLCDDLQQFVENNPNYEEEPSSIRFLPNEVVEFFKVAKEKGASPGPDGLSAETILMLILNNGDKSNSFLKSLCSYFDRLVHHKMPKTIWRVLTSAKLFGVTKSDGVSQRPLANGLLFRKAIASISLQKFSGDIMKALGPHQLGIAVTLGTEKIGHLFDHLFEDSNSFFIKTDFTNAFNSFNRSAAFQSLFEHIPKLGAIVYKFYGIPNTLLYDNFDPITVNMGSQQGCPFGPLLFCFAFKPILDQLAVEFPECLLKGYIDDVSIAVKKNNIGIVQDIMRVFEDSARGINLKLNRSKCIIVVPDQTQSMIAPVAENAFKDLEESLAAFDKNRAYKSTLEILNSVGFIQDNIVFNNPREESSKIGINILGFPIGTKAFKSAFFEDAVDIYIKQASCIRNLHHYQTEWSLFLYCLQSKITHLLRVIHPDITIPLLGRLMQFDTKLLMSIFDLNGLNNDIKKQISNQFMLKVTEGGFNKKNYNHTAVAAFLGSALTSYSYVKKEVNSFSPLCNTSVWLANCSSLLFNFRKISEGANAIMPTNEVSIDHICHVETFLSSLMTADHKGNLSSFTFKKLQKRFSEVLYQRLTKTFERLPDGGDGNAMPRTNQFYSGKWLLLTPSPNTFIENAVFRIAIALKLNLDLIGDGHLCYHCGNPVDPKGHHFLSCNCASLKQCHNDVRDVIAELLKRLGYTVFVGELPINSLNGISPRNSDNDLEVFRSNRRMISSNPSNTNNSTIGTRVDILATKPGTNEKPIYMDVQVINSVAPSFVSLENKEAEKEALHKVAVEAQHGEYWAPTFDCFGNPSRNTEKMVKALYEKYLASLPSNAKALMIADGRQLNYWLSRISFSINHMKAYKTLMLLNDLKGNIMGKGSPSDILAQYCAQNVMRQASN